MEIEQYYKLLEQENTELRAISYYKEKKEIKSKIDEIIEVSDFDSFNKFCKKYNGKANIYAGVHERVKGGSKAKDVKSIRIIALDLDSNHPVNQAANKEELERCKQEVFIMVDELAAKYGRPSIVMTGNGFQLLWKIRVININISNRELIEKKLKKFISNTQKKYNSDSIKIDQIGDLPRILKVAGTKSVKGENTKERPYRESYFVEYNTGISDSLRDVILTTVIEEEKPKGEPIKPQQTQTGRFDYLLKKDPKLSSLYSGNIAGYKSKSEAEMALVCKLVFYEFQDSEINTILSHSGIGKWTKAHNNYRDMTISKARLFIVEKKQDLTSVNLQDVYNIVSKWLYLKDFYAIDLLLAIVLSQRCKGSPIWMIFVGASGDGKSEMARMVDHLSCVYKVDQITPNTIVSGHEKAPDLAPKLDNKIMLITDFASILSLNGDAQKQIFAQLRNLYDGEAYKDSGAGARKHYSDLRVSLVANSTPVINHRILIHQDLGTRELIYRTDSKEDSSDFEQKARRAMENESKKKEMRIEIKATVDSFLNNIEFRDIELSQDIKDWLFEKAKWLSIMRSTASMDSYSADLISDVTPEVPTRLLMQLKVIFQCLKCLDRDFSDDRAKEVILRIINSSAKDNRVKIYEYLKNCSEPQTSSSIAAALKLGKKTVIGECNVLWNLDLIHCRKEITQSFGREFDISYWSMKEEPVEEEQVE